MADYFQSSPNFTNPSYATPEQLAQQRAYAAELTKRSGQEVNRPTGALANIINALSGNLARNNANEIQAQAAGQNAGDVSALIAQLQKGQPIDPNTAGRVYANPMASPEHRALIGALVTPQPVKSEYGQPAYQSPSSGVQPAPIAGQPGAYNPAYRVEQGAEGVHSNAPFPAPNPVPATPPGVTRLDPAATNAWRQNNPLPPGVAPPQPGVPPTAAPVAVAAPNGAPNAPLSLDQLAAKGREFAAQKAFTQGGADAITNVQKDDIAASTTAPTIKRVAGVMLNDLQSHGDQMTFGPTAQWSNDVKRLAANYAPGIMKDKLEGLASADSFDKMSAQLTSLLSKGGGTDAQLFNNMKSVPGSHNSKEGAEALLKMTIQVADQQQALRQATNNVPLAQYEAARNKFYAENPIINPITGNPIKLDIEAEKQNTGSGGFKVLKVH